MSRLPIRGRLTAAFAAAMFVVLAVTGLFVYLRLQADLDESLTASLQARADAVAELASRSAAPLTSATPGVLGEPDESFAAVLSPAGRLTDASGGARGPLLRAADLRRLRQRTVLVERRVAGIDSEARVLARRASARADSPLVVVGQSLEDRDETLDGLVAAFAVGGPVAVLLASLLGYALATAGLRPVEAMRRRATEVSLSGGEEALPLPAAHDEIRRLGETLNEMLERLRRSFERERRFVADASHELRTPVAVIKTELDAALRTGDLGPHARASVLAAAEECDSLAQLAEDLLVVARAADGKLPVRREPLEARSVLDDVRERFVDRAAGLGRSIRVEAPDRLTLSGDPLRLRQALGNVIDNALRHGAGEVVLAARPADGAVELEVSDEGAGFERTIAERAFERFTRGDEARTRSGSGLGLAIVRAVAEAHDGRVSIVGAGGAVVRISLPKGSTGRPEPEASDTAEPRLAPSPGGIGSQS